MDKFAIDQIINDIVILENLDTKEKKEVSLNILPNTVKEGSILQYDGNSYKELKNLEEERRISLRERLERLKAMGESNEKDN